MKNLTIVLALIVAAFALGSCGEPIPVERIAWEPDGNGYLQFRTNDERDYDTPFIYIPNDPGNVLTGGADWTAQADVIQQAGTTIGGHGLVVGFDGLATPTDNCVVLLVNCMRQYAILRRETGIFYTLRDWTSSSDLNIYKQVNTLRVEYSQSGSKLTFYANGHELCQVIGYSVSENTQAGFINAILNHDYEGFPKAHSDRRFKLDLPVVYPAP